MRRREFMVAFLSGVGTMLLMPLQALAAAWNREAFEATKLPEALKGLQADDQLASDQIQISGIQGALSSNAQIGSITVADPCGEIVTVQSGIRRRLAASTCPAVMSSSR